MAQTEEVARLTTTFACNDQMSKALANITTGVAQLTNKFETLQHEMKDVATTDPFASAPVSAKAMDAIQRSLISSTSDLASRIGIGATAQQLFTEAIVGTNVAMKGLLLTMAPFAVAVGAVYALMNSMDQVDYYSGLQARLSLITGDLEKVDELNTKLYQSAQRARGGYSEMADNVSKLGLLAGHAFNNTDEMVVFVEQLQKQFKIAGAGAQEASSAMYQLTQAMASGRLQGDEFRSIMENAPMLAKAIADEMGVPIAKMRELSSEGLITSDVIKRALTNPEAMEQVNKQFESIPTKFSEIVTSLANVAQTEFGPVFDKISDALNSDGMAKALSVISVGIKGLAVVASGAIDVVSALGGVLEWTGGLVSSLASVVIGMVPVALQALAVAGGAYLGYLIAINAHWIIAVGLGAITATTLATMGALHVILNGAMAITVATLRTMSYVYWVLNGAMSVKNALVVAYTNITSLARIKTLAIVGATKLWNLVLMANPLGVVIGLVGGLIAFFGLLKLRTLDIRKTLADTWTTIGLGAGEAINYIIDKLNLLVKAMNAGGKMFGKLFGFEYEEIKEIGHVDVTGAVKTVAGIIENGDLGSLFGGAPDMTIPELKVEGVNGINEATQKTAENTGSIKDAMEQNFESLEELRQLALGDGVSNITKQDIKIEVVNHNNVNSELDIDGIGDTIAQSLFRAVHTNRNGV